MLKFNLNFLLILLVIYILVESIKNSKKIENFESPAVRLTKFNKYEGEDTILNIRNKYLCSKLDIDNLGEISKHLIKNGLTVPGDLTINGDLKVDKDMDYLKGIIIPFHGNNIPDGWAECDGKDGRPDLRGRFILGYGSGIDLTPRRLLEKGGQDKVKLNIQNLPDHNHGTTTTTSNGDHKHNAKTRTIEWWGGDSDGSDCGCYVPQANRKHTKCGCPRMKTKSYNPAGAHKHAFTTSDQGGNGSHNNMPSYLPLKYIIKI